MENPYCSCKTNMAHSCSPYGQSLTQLYADNTCSVALPSAATDSTGEIPVGYTPLHVAVWHGRLELLRWMSEQPGFEQVSQGLQLQSLWIIRTVAAG